MLIPVILSGGSGTRLWPLSRKTQPKQLLRLIDEHSLIQHTALRSSKLPETTDPLIVCNQDHYFMISEQLAEIGIQPFDMLLEPFGKNTAPAIALGAMRIKALVGGNPVLLVMPADHLIKSDKLFANAVNNGIGAAKTGKLLTFGVKPTLPHTGYGYIQTETTLSNNVCPVSQFIEKPTIDQAKEYIEGENFYWNSGIFMFSADTYLRELKEHALDIYTACEKALFAATITKKYCRIDSNLFSECREDSIDYAVMEKTKQAALVPMESDWTDLGDWNAMADAHDADRHNNVIKGDVITDNVSNSYLYSEGRVLAALGIKDQIVIETEDALLVAHKDYAQNVKGIVSQLHQKNYKAADTHNKVHRPWGYYETLALSKNFQVKRITIKPGAKISLQMHHHRAEHWVVVDGSAEVTRNNEVYALEKNESTYIPVGTKHRLTNSGNNPLIVIEVQSGDYLGEDDIVRFDDAYGREVKDITQ